MNNVLSDIVVGARPIGPAHPCFLVAEIGINHNGDLDLAKRSCAAAAAAGADAVKFQNYRTEDFLSDQTLIYTYRSNGREITESQWDMFKRAEPGPEWARILQDYCDTLGITFFSTPTSAEGVAELVEAGSRLLKNGSDCLTHLPLLESMGATGLPIVVSTGMANAQDVDDALHAVRRGGTCDVILLHCTSAYPTAKDQTNLRRMVALRERFGVLVGFSDHTEGWYAAVQAVTLGAVLIEKHFTLGHEFPGPDHWFSSTPEEFAELVKQVRDAESRMGRADVAPAAVEVHARCAYRLGLVAAVDLEIGTTLTPEHISIRRPGGALLPKDLPRVVGRQLSRTVPRGRPIDEADFT